MHPALPCLRGILERLGESQFQLQGGLPASLGEIGGTVEEVDGADEMRGGKSLGEVSVLLFHLGSDLQLGGIAQTGQEHTAQEIHHLAGKLARVAAAIERLMDGGQPFSSFFG